MAIAFLGVVGSGSATNATSLTITLTADVGQTTDTETRLAVVLAHASTYHSGTTTLGGSLDTPSDNAAVSEPRYLCYDSGNPVKLMAGLEAAATTHSGPPGDESYSVSGAAYAILALQALLTGDQITIPISGNAVGLVEATVLAYSGLWIDGDGFATLNWGEVPFEPGGFGRCSAAAFDNGSGVSHTLDDTTCDFFNPFDSGSEFALYFGQQWDQSPTSLTWLDGGVNLRDSAYHGGTSHTGWIVGDQAVTPEGTYEFGGTSDVVGQTNPVYPHASENAVEWAIYTWVSGVGPAYCPVAFAGVDASFGGLSEGAPGGGGTIGPGQTAITHQRRKTSALGT